MNNIALNQTALSEHVNAATDDKPAPVTGGSAEFGDPGYVPYVPPEKPSIFSLALNHVPLSAPFRWLAMGWKDYTCCPKTGLFYGVAFFLMGHSLWAVFNSAPAYVMGLSAGFLLMGPFLCLGLYHASRSIERGERPSLRDTLMAWRPTLGAMAVFAGVLLILEMLWGRASLIVFAVAFNTVPGATDTMSQLLNPENLGFLITYAAVGGVFAGLIFITSVIAIPMIMDRQVDAVSAGLTSIRACIGNPDTMFVWGALITLLIGLSMLPYFLGLIVVGPVVGHATWHAYRAIVPMPEASPTTEN